MNRTDRIGRKYRFTGLSPFVFLILAASAEPDAPPEAYLPGATEPYFGSVDDWNMRFFTEHIDRLYNRRGQRQMWDIVRGRLDDAEEYCKKLIAEDAKDLESLFNLTVVHCRRGRVEEAIDTMKKALDAGLPFERFLAGPRDYLKPLTDSPVFKSMVKEQGVQLLHGPMVGTVTDRSARFWVRMADEVHVEIQACSNKEFLGPVASGKASASAEKDYTAVIEVANLEPGKKYFYRVLIDGKEIKTSLRLKFETYPSKGTKGTYRFAFGGGAGYHPKNERMWDTILSKDLDALLLLGDNVYIDMPEEHGPFHDYTYYRRQSRPEFRRLISRTPTYAIWDDHDCAMDDLFFGPYRDKPPWKPSLLRGFQRNWVNPSYGDGEWPGCWFQFSIGDIDLFLLDGRYYRTNPYSESPTMLGPVQKKWLFDSLKRSKATFKVLASPVPWSFGAKDQLDTWNGFKAEREEILSYIEDNKIGGVFLIAADRHRSDAWRIDREEGYPFYEFESSKLTNVPSHELMPEALFGYNEKCSFGLVEMNTAKEEPSVTYRIVTIDDEVKGELTVSLSDLSLAN